MRSAKNLRWRRRAAKGAFALVMATSSIGLADSHWWAWQGTGFWDNRNWASFQGGSYTMNAPTNGDYAYIECSWNATAWMHGLTTYTAPGLAGLYVSGTGTATANVVEQFNNQMYVSGSEYIGFDSYSRGVYQQSSGGNTATGYIWLGYNQFASGTYTLSGSGTLNAGSIVVGDDFQATGYFAQQGGAVNVTNSVALGSYDSLSAGTYNLAGGTLSTGSLIVGDIGIGNFIHSVGQVSTTGSLVIGQSSLSAGQYTLNSGTLVAGNGLKVGNLGTGTLTQNGGAVWVTNNVALGASDVDSSGTYNLAGGLLIAGGIRVGDVGEGTLLVNSATATINVPGVVSVGATSTGYGTISQSTGNLNASTLDLGLDGHGTLLLNGGSVNVGSYEAVGGDHGTGTDGTGYVVQNGGTNSAYAISIGDGTSSFGEYTMTGGTLADSHSLTVGYNGIGGLVQTGTLCSVIDTGDGVSVGWGTLATGYYQLSNGTLSASNEYVGTYGVGTFYQARGTNTCGALRVGYVGPGAYFIYDGSLVGTGSLSVSNTGTVGSVFAHGGGNVTFPYVNIGTNGSYLMSGGTLNAGSMAVGSAGHGTLTINSGTANVIVTDVLSVGSTSTGFGSISVSAGSLSANLLTIGAGGTGTLLLSGSGALNISGAEYFGGDYYVGIGAGSGFGVQTGGSNTTDLISLGDPVSGVAKYSISGGSLTTKSGLIVGDFGTAEMYQSGSLSSVSLGNALMLAYGSEARGYYQLSDGSLCSYDEIIGDYGTGSFDQIGGSNRCENLSLGGPTGRGCYTMNGGTLVCANGLDVASGGTIESSFRQTVGAVSFRILDLGASGAYYLDGGTLTGAGTSLEPNLLEIYNAGTFNWSGGTFSVDNISIIRGTMVLQDGPAHPLRTKTLGINSGRLDLGKQDAIIDYSGDNPLQSIASMIKTGYAGGSWGASGMTSFWASKVAADAGNLHKTALGYADASSLGLSTFDGQAIDDTCVLVRYTYFGDANLDGVVNTLDFNMLAAQFNSSNQVWTDGDFNYDGIVNALDFNALATNFGQALSSPAQGAMVPETASIVLLAIAGCRSRSRRRQ